MDRLKKISSRIYSSGFLILCGLVGIIYGTLIFISIQQNIAQADLSSKIPGLQAIVYKPLSNDELLQAQYDSATANLTPLNNREAISRLVEIAVKHGIDTNPNSGKFVVPPSSTAIEKVGSTSYTVILFGGIHLQGIPDNVYAFLNDIESGDTYNTIVITAASFSDITTSASGEEGERRAEFREISQAVQDMMQDNNLLYILNPVDVNGGVATNYMGDDPATESFEGFPDATTSVIRKGYTGNGDPKPGYILFEHDKISVNNPSTFTTVNYTDNLQTKYYYTCQANGEVRQWDGPDLSDAKEYFISEPQTVELVVTLSLKMYTKK